MKNPPKLCVLKFQKGFQKRLWDIRKLAVDNLQKKKDYRTEMKFYIYLENCKKYLSCIP